MQSIGRCMEFASKQVAHLIVLFQFQPKQADDTSFNRECVLVVYTSATTTTIKNQTVVISKQRHTRDIIT